MAVIGIDLGTRYSAAARCVDDQTEIILLDGENKLPSVVGVLANGKIAVGRKAKLNQAKNPQNTVLDAMRKMGTSEKIMLGTKEYCAGNFRHDPKDD